MTEQVRCTLCGLLWPEIGIAVRHVQRAHSEFRYVGDEHRIAQQIAGVLRREAKTDA